jgi:quercetin dioxygenase-like cupin family protein
MSLKKSTEIAKEKIEAGYRTYKQVLISSSEAPNFAMRKFIIEPGGSMPLHTNIVEHEQYVLNGSAEVQIGEETTIVEKNDVVYIPKGVKHNYKTVGDCAFEFLCIVPNNRDEIKILDLE